MTEGSEDRTIRSAVPATGNARWFLAAFGLMLSIGLLVVIWYADFQQGISGPGPMFIGAFSLAGAIHGYIVFRPGHP